MFLRGPRSVLSKLKTRSLILVVGVEARPCVLNVTAELPPAHSVCSIDS